MISQGNTGSLGHVRALPIPTKDPKTPGSKPRAGHKPIKHGTPRGYDRHRELGTKPCEDCLQAVKTKPAKVAKPKRSWDVADAAAVYLAGASLAKAAAQFGTDKPTMRAALVEHGIEIRKPGGGHLRKRAGKQGKPREYRPPFDVEKGRELYESGLSFLKVAEALGVKTEKTVRVHLTKAGVVSRPRYVTHKGKRRPNIVLPISEIATAYEAGATLLELADQHGVSDRTIRSRLIDAGVKLRHGGMTGRRSANAVPLETEAEIFRLIGEGVSIRQTSIRLGVPQSTIYDIRKRRATA